MIFPLYFSRGFALFRVLLNYSFCLLGRRRHSGEVPFLFCLKMKSFNPLIMSQIGFIGQFHISRILWHRTCLSYVSMAKAWPENLSLRFKGFILFFIVNGILMSFITDFLPTLPLNWGKPCGRKEIKKSLMA